MRIGDMQELSIEQDMKGEHMDDNELNIRTQEYIKGYNDAAQAYKDMYEPISKYGRFLLSQVRIDVKDLDGDEFEIGDLEGNRFRYELVDKADVLKVIDKWFGYLAERVVKGELDE